MFNGKSLLDATHPINSLYITKTNDSSPAELFGGTWTKLAENVVLPLGNEAPVYTDINKVTNVNAIDPNNGNRVNNMLLVNYSGSDSKYYRNPTMNNATSLKYDTNLHADLTQATNAISSVDVWQRVE